jgi:hypothetical protein
MAQIVGKQKFQKIYATRKLIINKALSITELHFFLTLAQAYYSNLNFSSIGYFELNRKSLLFCFEPGEYFIQISPTLWGN